MAKIKPRHLRIKQKDRWGVVLLVVSLVIISVGAGFYFYLRGNSSKFDKDTYCPRDGESSITVILFDRSDALNVVQQEALRRHLDRVKGELNQHEKLVIYLIDDTKNQLLTPFFEMCNPGKGDDVSPLIGSPALVKKRWNEGFSRKVDVVIADMIRPSTAPHSPIMESIQAVAIRHFGDKRIFQKRLVIASDMIQNTPGHSQFRGVMPFNDFKQTAYFRHVLAHLNGVEVKLFYINFDSGRSISGPKHLEFWQHYFSEMGGKLDRFVPLEG